jgi:endonuclease III
MKNAKTYEKAVRKLLGQLPRRKRFGPEDPMEILLESILLSNAAVGQAQEALAVLKREYVDFNELRVAPAREIVELIGEDYPQGRQKANIITTVLRNLFVSVGTLSLESLRDLPKRELRRRLQELGLDSFAGAAVTLRVFGGHAVPVDAALVEVLEQDGLVHPGSRVEDVQGFLERVVSQKDAPEVFEALRAYVEKHPEVLARRRQPEEVAVQEDADAAPVASDEEPAAAGASPEADKPQRDDKSSAAPGRASRKSTRKASLADKTETP